MGENVRVGNVETGTNGRRFQDTTPSRSSEFEGYTSGSSYSSHENKRKRRYQNHSYDEFKKAMPTTFNGEIKNGQEAEAWLLGMRKYFQVEDYSGNMKARVAIFNLNGIKSI